MSFAVRLDTNFNHTVCNAFCIVFMHFSMVKYFVLCFSMIKASFLD